MTCFVDDFYAGYGTMKMCHLISDTDAELFAMVDRIGVKRKWHQAPPAHDSHFDICISKRKLAVEAGAVEVTAKQLAAMNRRRKVTGELGSPDDAIAWYLEWSMQGRTD
jgi:hypothetical protein